MESYRRKYPRLFQELERIHGHAVRTYSETFTVERSDYNLVIRTANSTATVGLYDFGKFLDCFPVADPQSGAEVRALYDTKEQCGILLPSMLMPVYQEQLIARMYGIANRLAEIVYPAA